MHDSCIRICTTLIPALKAPPQSSPGQRPGFRNRSVRPARAEDSSALAGRNMDSDTFPGRCPGLVCSAPMARHGEPERRAMKMHLLRRIATSITVVFCVASLAYGAEVTGTVKGPDGAPFEGAFVQATNTKPKITVR